MWILIDNYDSFTHILQDYLLQTGNECKVLRNDEVSIGELEALNPDRIILSPGPETPLQAGITMDVVKHFYNNIPLLGVCLGHQAMGMFFGGKLTHIPYPMHGKTSLVSHKGHQLFSGIDNEFEVMRYHSLAITDVEQTDLEVIATSQDDNQIMALTHKQYPCVGVQFHPESIGTNVGLLILRNWANMY